MPVARKSEVVTGRLKAVDRRAAIVRAAHKLFMTDGYDAARMEDIAVAADCSTGPLYHVFSSKKEVFEAVILAAIANLQSSILEWREMHKEASPLTRILISCCRVRPRGCWGRSGGANCATAK